MFFCLGTGSKETDIACLDSTFIWKWSELLSNYHFYDVPITSIIKMFYISCKS